MFTHHHFVCRLFLLLVLLSMIAELGGIITLNVLGQVCQFLKSISHIIQLSCICCNQWIVFVDSCELYFWVTMSSDRFAILRSSHIILLQSCANLNHRHKQSVSSPKPSFHTYSLASPHSPLTPEIGYFNELEAISRKATTIYILGENYDIHRELADILTVVHCIFEIIELHLLARVNCICFMQ